MHRRLELRVPAGAALGLAPAHLAVTLHLPASGARSPAALFCFPGGGMNRRYFDLEGASFAQAMTAEGFVVAAFDHFGAGESDHPQDGWALSADIMAQVNARGAASLARMLAQGDAAAQVPACGALARIAVGHSMGAMMAILQQDQARPYRALALLCFGTRGLPEILTPEEMDVARSPLRGLADYVRIARQRFGAPWADIQARAHGNPALAAAAAPLPAVAGMQSMLPNNVGAEAARIAVPVFIAVGDRDMVGRPERIPPAFPAAPAHRLLVLPGTGHHPFVGASAALLTRELAAWAHAQAEDQAQEQGGARAGAPACGARA